MNLQHERIAALCNELRLAAVADRYPELATRAVENEQSYADFLEGVLSAEHSTRQGRTRSTMTRLAGFPAIKTLDEFDYEFAPGVPKATIAELSGLAFIDATRTWCWSAPAASARPTWLSLWVTWQRRLASRRAS